MWTFSRYRLRSSRVNCRASTSAPMRHPDPSAATATRASRLGLGSTIVHAPDPSGPVPPGRRAPPERPDPSRRPVHRSVRMAAGQGRPRGDRLSRGRERLHRGPDQHISDRCATRSSARSRPGPRRPISRFRATRPTRRLRLLVLRPHRGGLGVRDLLPGSGHRSAPSAGRKPTDPRRAGAARRQPRGAGHEFFSLGAFSVSPDGRLLAYSIDLSGAERFTLADQGPDDR